MPKLKLQGLFGRVRKTHDPAAGSANETLIRLVKRGDRGFRFRSEEEARCNADFNLLLNMGLAVWKDTTISGIPMGGVVCWSEGTKRTLTHR